MCVRIVRPGDVIVTASIYILVTFQTDGDRAVFIEQYHQQDQHHHQVLCGHNVGDHVYLHLAINISR